MRNKTQENNSSRGNMTVKEAGRRGGQKGGKTTKMRYGKGFYSEIGTKGGRRVRDLIRRGKENERAEYEESVD
jgi:general stress protein YciG